MEAEKKSSHAGAWEPERQNITFYFWFVTLQAVSEFTPTRE